MNREPNEEPLSGQPPAPSGQRVARAVFRSGLSTWNTLFDQAADFASKLGSGRLINISHSADRGEGLVVVWYWDENDSIDP